MDWVNPDQVQLWQYVQGLQKLGQLWVESLCQPLESRDSETFDNPSASSELTDLYWNVYAKTFGNVLQSPSLGYAREFNNKLLKGFDAWINFYRASFDYQAVLVVSGSGPSRS